MAAVATGPATVPLPGGAVDLVRGDVVRDGRVVARLTARDLELLAYLVEHAGEDLPRDRLAAEVLGQRPGTVSRAVDSAVFRLRAKLERDPGQPVSLITVQGHGYRWLSTAPAPAPSRLPAPRDALIPRPALWARIDAALAGGRCVLVGPPGIGKSSAAIGWALARGASAALVELAGQASAAAAVARALELPAGDAEAVGYALAARGDLVVILDDADEAAVDAVERWRRLAPRARWLLTSRIRPAWPDAAVVPVDPLPLDDGVALFRARARAVRGGVDLRDDVLADVQALVRALDGVPLAIELAASRAAAFSPAQLLERLPAGLRLLDGARGRSGPQASLRGAIEQSWTLLSPDDQALFARLSVFAGTFTGDAAGAVIGADADGALASLARRSLVAADRGYRLLHSLRAFAAERLEERPDDRADAFRRHAAWFTRDAARVQREVLGPIGVALAERLSAERDDLRLVVERFRHVDPHLAGWAVIVASPGVLRAERDEVFERGAVDLAERLLGDEGAPLALRYAVQRVASYVHRRTGAFREAEACVDAAERLAAGLDEHARIRALADRCGIGVATGRLDDAIRWGGAARAGAERIGDEPLLALVHADLAVALKQRGRIDEAVASYERSLELLARTGGDVLRGLVLSNLGVIDAERGRAELARQRFEEAVALHRRLGNLRSSGTALMNLALLDDEDGDELRALERYHEALDVMLRTGSRRFEGACRANLGGALGRSGRPVAARQHLRRAREIAVDLDLPRDAAIADGELGIVAWAEGRRAEALRLLQSAASYPVGTRYEALYRAFVGALLALEGDPGAGRDDLASAWAAAARADDPSLPPVLARMAAIVDLAEGRPPASPIPPARGWWGRYADQRLREVSPGLRAR